MKKVISILLLTICMAFVFTGCKSKNTASYNKQELNTVLKSNIEEALDIHEAEINNKYPVEEDVIKKAKVSFTDTKEVCGEFIDFDAKGAKFSYVNGEINAEYLISCDKKKMLATATFKYDEANDNKLTLTSVSFEPVYTTGEKLVQAGSNTLIGMGTVFAVLIFISLVISLFKFIPKISALLSKHKERKDHRPVVLKKYKDSDNSVNSGKITDEKEEVTKADDGELIAVIAAAISASTGMSTDDFVVRSIRRRF